MTALRHETCDLLVVGAGPAGMAAAEAAAPSGARIVVIDDNPAPGGQVWRDGPGVALPTAARRQRETLARCVNVQLRNGWRVVAPGVSRDVGQRTLLLEGESDACTMSFASLILATGAREWLLPFPGWTLPGVTGAGGLQALIKGGLLVAGQRIVIAGSGPLLPAAAATARQAGAQVLLVAEQAAWADVVAFGADLWRWPGKAAQALALVPRNYRASSHVLEARGDGLLRSVRLSVGGRERTFDCDRLACGFGLVPNAELGQLLGCAVDERGGIVVDAMQATTVTGVHAAGECAGIGGAEAAALQGAIAGHAAVGKLDAARALWPRRASWARFALSLQRRFAPRAVLRQLVAADTLVCRCEDVPHGALAACSGWIDAKLQTRCGMGPCQGRVCGAAARFLYGWVPSPPRHLLAPARLDTLAALEAAAPEPP